MNTQNFNSQDSTAHNFAGSVNPNFITLKDFAFDTFLMSPALTDSAIDQFFAVNSAASFDAQALNGGTSASCRRTRLGITGVMEDAQVGTIQETRSEQRPARMVGLSILDSLLAEPHMEVSGRNRVESQRLRGET